jgi:predicted glycoside hydrolase/deacetylase ChbG (UPF0249 family)
VASVLKRLIINADDFGPNPRIVDAVVRAATEGCLTSTSVLVNLSDVASALAGLSRSGIGVGAHLNVTSGRPLAAACDIPSLLGADAGFVGREEFRLRAGSIDPLHLRIEFAAQVDRLRSLGVEPTHLDNHHPEIYLYPRLFQAVVDLAAERGLPVRLPFSQAPHPRTAAMAGDFGLTAENLASLGAGLRAQCKAAGVRHPDAFFLGLDSAGAPVEALRKLLATLPDGTSELCLHVGDQTAPQRRELEAVTTPGVRSIVSSFGIELVSFAQWHRTT